MNITKTQQNVATNDIERKYDYVINYPEFVNRQISDYRPYLATFTFNNSFKKLPIDRYRTFFSLFYAKLSQKLINRKAYYKKPKMMLIPEKSYQCVKTHMHACVHFHGFLFIHHLTHTKFTDRCLVEHVANSNEVKLHPKIINPYSLRENIICDGKLLTVNNLDLRKPETIDDVMKFANYSCKNFIKSEFSDTDTMLFVKDKKQRI